MTEKKPTIQLALIPLLSAVGASCAIYLSKHYYDLRAGTAGFKSGALCNINATMNCDAIATSRFAELIPGLPLSSFVAGWFVALIFIGLLARSPHWRKEATAAGTLMAGFASLYSVALLIIMTFVIQKFCLFCLVIDAVNFSLLGLFLWVARGNPFAGVQWKKLQMYGWITMGSLFILTVLLRPSAENERPEVTQAEIDYAVNQVLEQKPVDLKIPASATILGDPSALVTIVEFSDFQCPYCQRGAFLMKQLLSRHAGKVRVVFMPFPLDSSCNRLIQRPMHPYACELARTAFCASKQNKFEAVYEGIFEKQEFLKAESAKEIPAELGLDAKALAACVSSNEAKAELAASIDQGIALKVESTPTFFMNGRRISGLLPPDAWDLLIAKIPR